jgi:hypothetical protein
MKRWQWYQDVNVSPEMLLDNPAVVADCIASFAPDGSEPRSVQIDRWRVRIADAERWSADYPDLNLIPLRIYGVALMRKGMAWRTIRAQRKRKRA